MFYATIDCDLYSGYKSVIESIYNLSQKKSLIYLDEYYSLKFPGARIAVHEFTSKYKISPKLLSSDKYDFERWGIIKK